MNQPFRQGRRTPLARKTLHQRPRAFESATDELDEWMLACPQGDVLAPSS